MPQAAHSESANGADAANANPAIRETKSVDGHQAVNPRVMVLSLEGLRHEHYSMGHRAYNSIRKRHGMPIVDSSLNPPCSDCDKWKLKFGKKK